VLEMVRMVNGLDMEVCCTLGMINAAKRQDLKRKVQRWRKSYENLPRQERLAIMSALMDVESISSDNGSAI